MATGQVGVDEACSGIRSLHSALMLSLLLGELYLLRTGSRVVLFVASGILAFLVNVGRTFILSWVSSEHGTAALQKWHDPIGFAEAVACMTGLFILALCLRPGKAAVDSAEPEPKKSLERLPAAVPAFLCLFIVVWFVFVEAATWGWFRMRESEMAVLTKWSLELPDSAEGFRRTELSETAKRALRADETRSAQWRSPDGNLWQIYYIRWQHGSRTAQLATQHWPEICMTGAGKKLRSGPEIKSYDLGGLMLPFRVYAFDDKGATMFVFHGVWKERGGTSSELRLDGKPNLRSRMQAVWHGKRNLGQRVLEVGVWGFDDLASANAAFMRQLDKLVKVEKPAAD
jgi:exosortase/archaeosortase family protein